MLVRVVDNTSYYNLDNEDILRKVIVKIRLERINTQKGVTVEVLLDSRAIRLFISLQFARKQRSKLKKIERLICVRNVDSSFNKERPIEYIVEIDIDY